MLGCVTAVDGLDLARGPSTTPSEQHSAKHGRTTKYPSVVWPIEQGRPHGLLDLVCHGLGILVLPEAQHRPSGLL